MRDYSVVSGKKEGRHHPEGAKFGEFIDKVVAENVLMNDPSDCQFISNRMEADPIVLDGGDTSFVSRPRLWWASVDWQDLKVHPLTGHKVQWSQHNGHRQIKLDIPPQEVEHLTMRGLQFQEDIVQRRKKIHVSPLQARIHRGALRLRNIA